MKKLLLFLIFMFPSISYSNVYDGIWEVTDVVGERWFSLKKRHIGKTQEFYKGSAYGVFFTCNYRGLIDTTDSYTDRKSTRLNSSHALISYAVFCLKKKTTTFF